MNLSHTCKNIHLENDYGLSTNAKDLVNNCTQRVAADVVSIGKVIYGTTDPLCLLQETKRINEALIQIRLLHKLI